MNCFAIHLNLHNYTRTISYTVKTTLNSMDTWDWGLTLLGEYDSMNFQLHKRMYFIQEIKYRKTT